MDKRAIEKGSVLKAKDVQISVIDCSFDKAVKSERLSGSSISQIAKQVITSKQIKELSCTNTTRTGNIVTPMGSLQRNVNE